MSDQTPFDFGKMMPGFDFLQQLTGAGKRSAMPDLRHWIAPTVSVEEIEDRIGEMKTVQFWLEQNLLGVKATIQALEVQKMTLQTLRDMNLSLNEVAKAFTLPSAGTSGDEAPRASSAAAATAKNEAAETGRGGRASASADAESPASEAHADGDSEAKRAADPLQWWGALTQQFQQIAMQTLQEAATRRMPSTDTSARSAQTPAKRKTAAAKSTKSTARKKTAVKKTTAQKTTAKNAGAKKTAR